MPRAREESVTGERTDLASTSTVLLWEKVLERSNLQRAVKQVRQNKGAPGIDGMSGLDRIGQIAHARQRTRARRALTG
ncbi:hypothetical protein [Wenzhouxiangella sp. AB-CW3]|uniref:hypothetical protein n=1 Tax=Wenzhouxiangella sp. AB-CW3 TaxID=2771012 RepID=UPI001CC2B7D1|nr:hypothetical protein [Wenzhouxiangella sp. AB-CW3]